MGNAATTKKGDSTESGEYLQKCRASIEDEQVFLCQTNLAFVSLREVKVESWQIL